MAHLSSSTVIAALGLSLLLLAPSYGMRMNTAALDTPKTEARPPQNTGHTAEYEALMSELEWGTNYDPSLEFCGPYDCYAVLNLTYVEHKGEGNLEKGLLKAQYRAMSRKYHPDKVEVRLKGMKKKERKEIRSRFVYIAKANEVLSDAERKFSYDYYHTASESEYDSAFVREYSVINPKDSPLLAVVLGFLMVMSAITYVVQKSKYDKLKAHVVMAAKLDVSTKDGGTAESQRVRKVALALFQEMNGGQAEGGGGGGGGGKDSPGTGKKGKGKKGKGKKASVDISSLASAAAAADEGDEVDVPEELKKRLFKLAKANPPEKGPKSAMEREHKKTSLEIFIPDLCEFLYDDFGGGFRKAKVPDDLFAWMLCLWVAGLPRKTGSFLTWHWRRYNKVPYDKDEILYLTSSTLGVAFDVLEKEEVEEACKAKLWEDDEKLAEWYYGQDVKVFGKKRANLMRKARLGEPFTDSEEEDE